MCGRHSRWVKPWRLDDILDKPQGEEGYVNEEAPDSLLPSS